MLETNMNKLFESSKKPAAVSNAPNDEIIVHDTLFIQDKQIKTDKKFRMYYRTSLLSKEVFQMGVQKTLELTVDIQNYNVKFTAANRQLDFPLIP